MDAKTFWADSRGKVLTVLVVLWGSALLNQFRPAFLWHSILSVCLVTLFDVIIVRMRAKRWVMSLSSIITGLLIGMVFDPWSGFLPTAAACLFASGSKHFIGKSAHNHVFNPAALGIVASSWIFHRPVAWWAPSWGVAPVIMVSVGMFPILQQLRRLVSPIMFLIVFFLTNLFYGTAESAFRLTMDGTVLLFAFVMLPEPKTAPTQGKWRWGWGVLVGLLVVAQPLFRVSAIDPLLLALLVGNLYSFFLQKMALMKQWDTLADDAFPRARKS